MTQTQNEVMNEIAVRNMHYERGRLTRIGEHLMAITFDCRHNMHEPDEQGITGVVIGDTLDTACIATVLDADDIINGDGAEKPLVDLTLVLNKDADGDGETTTREIAGVSNIAEMIALIRMQAVEIQSLKTQVEEEKVKADKARTAMGVVSTMKQLLEDLEVEDSKE